MATIELYKSKINNMSNYINQAKSAVGDFCVDLSALKSKVLGINSSVCIVLSRASRPHLRHNTKKSGPQMGDKWIKNNIGKIVDDPDDIIEGLATGDTVKELFRVNVSNDNGLVNVTTSVKSLK